MGYAEQRVAREQWGVAAEAALLGDPAALAQRQADMEALVDWADQWRNAEPEQYLESQVENWGSW